MHAAAARSNDPAPSVERVLVIDDEPDLLDLLAFNLRDAGLVVEAAATAHEGARLAARWQPVVVVLDLMLPDGSGIDVCRRLREDAKTADVGVLMLTSRAEEYDRVLGFHVGADDYVTKPFSVREVTLRVRALARRVSDLRLARAAPSGGSGKYVWRDFTLDPSRHVARVDGVEMPLRPLEGRFLTVLFESPGRVFSRAELLNEVWGTSERRSSHVVDAYVRRVRERLGRHADLIETIPGFGYRLRRP